MSDQKSAPDIDPEDIKAAERAAGIETVPDDEELPPETAPNEPTADDMVVELEAQLAEAKADRLRAVAEAENTRKRAEREIANVRKYAAEPLARDFLQVSEFIRMALQSVTEEQADADPLLKNLRVGVAMTEKTLLDAFERNHVKQITAKPGDAYDHTSHEAISRVDAPEGIEPGQIVQMIGAGYRLHDRLIKPATVVVAQAPAAPADSDDEESAE
ncbi:MAG: nucleotide exchange factor GrpE [Alphaproteobacteria bacterium]